MTSEPASPAPVEDLPAQRKRKRIRSPSKKQKRRGPDNRVTQRSACAIHAWLHPKWYESTILFCFYIHLQSNLVDIELVKMAKPTKYWLH